MKKVALFFSAGCALFMATSVTAAAASPHGLSIYGKLQEQPISCTVLMSKYVVQLSAETTRLPEQDNTHPTLTKDDVIHIRLGGDNCDANESYKNIGLKFLGTADEAYGTVLANKTGDSSGATGVGVQLMDGSNNTRIIPNSTVGMFPPSTNGTLTDFTLNLSLVKLKGQTATTGSVKSDMTVQIERL